MRTIIYNKTTGNILANEDGEKAATGLPAGQTLGHSSEATGNEQNVSEISDLDLADLKQLWLDYKAAIQAADATLQAATNLAQIKTGLSQLTAALQLPLQRVMKIIANIAME